MKSLRLTQFLSLWAGVVILGIVAAASSIDSPVGVRRAADGILILFGAMGAFKHSRRLPASSPLVLCVTLIGLGITLVRPLLGRQFPMLLMILVGSIWLAVWISRWRERTWTA